MTERIFIPRTQEYVKDNRKYKNENEKTEKKYSDVTRVVITPQNRTLYYRLEL